jgi:hypothetical protein
MGVGMRGMLGGENGFFYGFMRGMRKRMFRRMMSGIF